MPCLRPGASRFAESLYPIVLVVYSPVKICSARPNKRQLSGRQIQSSAVNLRQKIIATSARLTIAITAGNRTVVME